jgi:HTH-type transcriptional regulator/antitoxin HigA
MRLNKKMSSVAFDSTAYRKLVTKNPPHIIRTEDENEEYIFVLEALYSRGKLSPEEKEYAELLTLLIEKFEERYDIGRSATPLDVLRSLMEARELKQSDMIDVFGSKGIASEVLRGKRDLSKTHIQRLSEKFHVSPEVFFEPASEA